MTGGRLTPAGSRDHLAPFGVVVADDPLACVHDPIRASGRRPTQMSWKARGARPECYSLAVTMPGVGQMRRREFSVCLAGVAWLAAAQSGNGRGEPMGDHAQHQRSISIRPQWGPPEGRAQQACGRFEDTPHHWCEPAAPGSKPCKVQRRWKPSTKKSPVNISVLHRAARYRVENVTSGTWTTNRPTSLLALRQRMIEARTAPRCSHRATLMGSA